MDNPIVRSLLTAFWVVTGFVLRYAGAFGGFYLAFALHSWRLGSCFFVVGLLITIGTAYQILGGLLDGCFEAWPFSNLVSELIAIPVIWVAATHYLLHSDFMISSGLHFALTTLLAVATVLLLWDKLSQIGHHRPMRISWFG